MALLTRESERVRGRSGQRGIFGRSAQHAAQAAGFDLLRALGWLVLHDVEVPGETDHLVDHLLAGPSGIFVVSIAPFSAPIRVSDDVIAGADAAEPLSVVRQAAAEVRRFVAGRPVAPVLCFEQTDAQLGLVDGVVVCTTENVLDVLISQPRLLSGSELAFVARLLNAGMQAAQGAAAVSAPSGRHRAETEPTTNGGDSAPSHSAPSHSAPSHSAPSHSAPSHSAHAVTDAAQLTEPGIETPEKVVLWNRTVVGAVPPEEAEAAKEAAPAEATHDQVDVLRALLEPHTCHRSETLAAPVEDVDHERERLEREAQRQAEAQARALAERRRAAADARAAEAAQAAAAEAEAERLRLEEFERIRRERVAHRVVEEIETWFEAALEEAVDEPEEPQESQADDPASGPAVSPKPRRRRARRRATRRRRLLSLGLVAGLALVAFAQAGDLSAQVSRILGPSTTDSAGTPMSLPGNGYHPEVEVVASYPRVTMAARGPKSTGSDLIAIRVRLQNLGASAWTPNLAEQITAIDETGTRHAVGRSGKPVVAGELLPLRPRLAPGDSASGYVVFTVPTGTELDRVQLRFSPDAGDRLVWTLR